MMDSGLIPIDKAYEAITSPAKRRKITVIKRQTTDPKAIQDARNLGKELFYEMGPDGEDAVFSFLQNKLKGCQTSLNGYKPLADTGNYPGQQEIAEGLLLLKKLLACDSSYKFIEQFNGQKADLLDLANKFNQLEQFYEHQKPTWEKLRKAYDRFQLNRLELERDTQAGPALARMKQILAAPSPYSLIREAEVLITTVGTVNTALVTARRTEDTKQIDSLLLKLTDEVEATGGNAGVRVACLTPLEALKTVVATSESLAHITQAASEALKEYDAACKRVEEYVKNLAKKPTQQGAPPIPTLKTKRVVEPSKLVTAPYLETQGDVDGFLDKLRKELEQAIASGERIEIR